MLALQNIETVYMVLGATVCMLLLFLMLSMGRINRLLKDSLEAQKEQNVSLVTSIRLLTEKTKDFEKEYKKLQVDLVVKERYGCVSGSYQQAINAAKSGAEVADLISNYDLTSSEAELLVSMHGKKIAIV